MQYKISLLTPIGGIGPGAKTLITAYGLFDATTNIKLITSNKVNNCDKTVEEMLKLKSPLLNYAPRQYSYSSRQYYHETEVNNKNKIGKMWLDISDVKLEEETIAASKNFDKSIILLEDELAFIDQKPNNDIDIELSIQVERVKKGVRVINVDKYVNGILSCKICQMSLNRDINGVINTNI